mgnify:CR=1 FL=1|jgi:hypothetical protein
MLQATIEPIMDGKDELNQETKDVLQDMMVEIEHLYREDEPYLIKLKTKLNENKG